MTASAVCGIYFLYRDGGLIYVGQSIRCHERIKAHRLNGREFDLATIMPVAREDLAIVEKALIESLNPPQNRMFAHSPLPRSKPKITLSVTRGAL